MCLCVVRAILYFWLLFCGAVIFVSLFYFVVVVVVIVLLLLFTLLIAMESIDSLNYTLTCPSMLVKRAYNEDLHLPEQELKTCVSNVWEIANKYELNIETKTSSFWHTVKNRIN